MKKARVLVPALLLVTSALVLGACSATGGDEAAGGRSADQAAAAATTPAALGAVEAGPGIVEAPTGADGVAPSDSGSSVAGEIGALPDVAAQLPGIEQRVVQTASLSIGVAKGRFDETVDRARSIVAGLNGFVTASSASQGVGERLVRGSLTVRVPQVAYAQAMAALSRLGTVRARNESGEDVSLHYVDLEARASQLEAVERQLLQFLDKTTTVADALVVQQRLADVQLQLEQVRGELRYLQSQTAYATIGIDVVERRVPVAGGPAADDDGWGFADAWRAAAHGFEKVLGGLLVALVVAGPILLALLVALLGWRHHRRRHQAPPAVESPV